MTFEYESGKILIEIIKTANIFFFKINSIYVTFLSIISFQTVKSVNTQKYILSISIVYREHETFWIADTVYQLTNGP